MPTSVKSPSRPKSPSQAPRKKHNLTRSSHVRDKSRHRAKSRRSRSYTRRSRSYRRRSSSSRSSSSSYYRPRHRRRYRRRRSRSYRRSHRRRHRSRSSHRSSRSRSRSTSSHKSDQKTEPEHEKLDTTPALSSEALKLLGSDVINNASQPLYITPQVDEKLCRVVSKGIPEEEREKLLVKYSIPPHWSAPKLNPEVSSTLTEAAKKRDQHLLASQQSVGAATAIIASVLSDRLVEDPNANKDEIHKLLDAADLLSSTFAKFNSARKAFIEPGLAKDVKDVLQDSTPSEFLYGPDLGDRVKNARAISKVGSSLKDQTPVPPTSTTKNSKKPPAYSRRPGGSKWYNNR